MVDAYGNDDGQQQPQDDWFTSNAPPQNPSTAGVGSPGNDANQIQGWASQFLGRTFNDADLQAHLQNPGGLAAVQNLIANSPEAQTFAASRQAGTGGPGTTGTGGTLRNILSPFTGSWSAQNAPVFQPGRAVPVFQKFDAPTLEQAKNEPGFQLALQEGQEGIQNSAAGRGLARSGGTLKDILKYNQNFANQNYQNVYNRGFNTWQANTSGDLNNWMAGERGNMDTFNAGMQSAGMNNDNSWKNYLQGFDQFKYNQQWPYQVLSDQQKIGISANQ